MSYIDKVSVGGTEYDIQDSNAARQTEVDELKSAMDEVQSIRETTETDISSLFERTHVANNGATYSDGTLTVPSGNTGHNSYVAFRAIANFSELKGETIDVEIPFTVSEALTNIVSVYVALNGTGYSINSATWDGEKVKANITIDSDATSTYVLIGLIISNSTALSTSGTMTIGSVSADSVTFESYENAIIRITDAVQYTAQSKSTDQKTQARMNIGAASDAEVAVIKNAVDEIQEIRKTDPVIISSLFERVAANQNGASTSSGVMTIPSGSTGNTSYIGVRCQGANFTSIKGKTISVVCPFAVSENLSDKVSANILINGTGYTINSSTWENGELTADVTINEDATSTYLVAALKVTNTSPLESNGTITVGSWSAFYETFESYENAIERLAEDAVGNDILVDHTTLNLFDKTKAVTTGMWGNTGSFITTSYQNSTGLIPIGDYTTFRMNRDESTVPTWTLWKSDGTTFVRGVQARSITIDPTTDSEAAYLRCSFLATEIDTVMIIPNAHPCMSEYFPYNSPRKSMKGEWVGKHLVTIGDSLTQMGYWQEMVTQMLGMSYTVAAQSGGNMTAIAGFVDSVTDADAMTVWAGTNDWYGGISLGTLLGTDRNTYYGALRHVCEEVSTNLPGCKLLFITPLQRNTTNTDSWEEDSRGFKKNPTTGHTLEEFANAMIATAEIYGFPVLDMFHHGGVNKINIDAWTSDKLHPSKAQFERLAWKIISKINSI